MSRKKLDQSGDDDEAWVCHASCLRDHTDDGLCLVCDKPYSTEHTGHRCLHGPQSRGCWRNPKTQQDPPLICDPRHPRPCGPQCEEFEYHLNERDPAWRNCVVCKEPFVKHSGHMCPPTAGKEEATGKEPRRGAFLVEYGHKQWTPVSDEEASRSRVDPVLNQLERSKATKTKLSRAAAEKLQRGDVTLHADVATAIAYHRQRQAHQSCAPVVKILIVGGHGAGKTHHCNQLCGARVFTEGACARSVTRFVEGASFTRVRNQEEETSYLVLNVPGFRNDTSDEELYIASCVEDAVRALSVPHHNGPSATHPNAVSMPQSLTKVVFVLQLSTGHRIASELEFLDVMKLFVQFAHVNPASVLIAVNRIHASAPKSYTEAVEAQIRQHLERVDRNYANCEMVFLRTQEDPLLDDPNQAHEVPIDTGNQEALWSALDRVVAAPVFPSDTHFQTGRMRQRTVQQESSQRDYLRIWLKDEVAAVGKLQSCATALKNLNSIPHRNDKERPLIERGGRACNRVIAHLEDRAKHLNQALSLVDPRRTLRALLDSHTANQPMLAEFQSTMAECLQFSPGSVPATEGNAGRVKATLNEFGVGLNLLASSFEQGSKTLTEDMCQVQIDYTTVAAAASRGVHVDPMSSQAPPLPSNQPPPPSGRAVGKVARCFRVLESASSTTQARDAAASELEELCKNRPLELALRAPARTAAACPTTQPRTRLEDAELTQELARLGVTTDEQISRRVRKILLTGDSGVGKSFLGNEILGGPCFGAEDFRSNHNTSYTEFHWMRVPTTRADGTVEDDLWIVYNVPGLVDEQSHANVTAAAVNSHEVTLAINHLPAARTTVLIVQMPGPGGRASFQACETASQVLRCLDMPAENVGLIVNHCSITSLDQPNYIGEFTTEVLAGLNLNPSPSIHFLPLVNCDRQSQASFDSNPLLLYLRSQLVMILWQPHLDGVRNLRFKEGKKLQTALEERTKERAEAQARQEEVRRQMDEAARLDRAAHAERMAGVRLAQEAANTEAQRRIDEARRKHEGCVIQ